MLVSSFLQHCGDAPSRSQDKDTLRQRSWIKSALVHHQQPGLVSHQPEHQQTQMQQPAPILSSEDRQRTTFFFFLGSISWGLLFSHHFRLFMFINSYSQSWWEMRHGYRPDLCLVCSLCQATLTGRRVIEGEVQMCRCGLWWCFLTLSNWTWDCTWLCLCQVWFCLHVSVFTKWFMYFFLCCSTLPFTIIVIITLERGSAELQSIDHYESTAWALQKPRTCQGMWSCVCMCVCAQYLAVCNLRVKKHNCSSFSKIGT